MALSKRFPVLLAGALAAAIAMAPAATAAPRPGCDKASGCSQPAPVQIQPERQNQQSRQNQLSTDFTSKDLPKGWTNEALWARPGASNPFGLGPKPPVLALD